MCVVDAFRTSAILSRVYPPPPLQDGTSGSDFLNAVAMVDDGVVMTGQAGKITAYTRVTAHREHRIVITVISPRDSNRYTRLWENSVAHGNEINGTEQNFFIST